LFKDTEAVADGIMPLSFPFDNVFIEKITDGPVLRQNGAGLNRQRYSG